MAKTSLPPRASRNAPHAKVHRYIDALVTDDFGRPSKLTTCSANSFAKKKYDSASQALQLKIERRERQARRIEIRDWRAAERSVAAELRESDARARVMWRSLKTKVRPEKSLKHTRPRERKHSWLHASVALPKYGGPVIDRRGQRGVFARFRYYSRKSAKTGVSSRVVVYCFNGAELDNDGVPYVASNLGLTIDEVLCGFDHLEQINWAAATNAKLLMHGIFAVDHRQSPDEMMTCGVRWAEETLGTFDLPYLVTLHAPPPDGDERNWHLHILWSFRPMVRTGDHEWEVGEMLRTDLDNPAAMKVFRDKFAVVMTDMSFEAGQNQVYTAKSNTDRGLPHEPQAHLGGADTNRTRNGEYVATNEENHERVMRSKTAVLDDDLRHADEILARAQQAARALAAQFAHLPAPLIQLPKRIAAAAMAIDIPAMGRAPSLSSAPIVARATPLPVRAVPLPIYGMLEPIAPLRQPPRRSSVITVQAIPRQPARTASRVEIANLRIRPLLEAEPKNVISGILLFQPSRTSIPSLALPQLVNRLRIVRNERPAIMPAATVIAVVPKLPALMPIEAKRSGYDSFLGTVMSAERMPERSIKVSAVRLKILIETPPVISDVQAIYRAIERITVATRSDDERHARESANAKRAEQELKMRADQRQAIENLLHMTSEERHYLKLAEGRRIVNPTMLARFGLSADDVTGTHVQTRLARIAERQSDEIAQLHAYMTIEPDDLVKDGPYWSFHKRAPVEMRTLIKAWRNDRTVQNSIQHFANKNTKATNSASLQQSALADVTLNGWQRARRNRDLAMNNWDNVERLDGTGIEPPGRQISRPRTDPGVNQVDRPRRFPGPPGSGLGG